jgi:hypothetical protein
MEDDGGKQRHVCAASHEAWALTGGAGHEDPEQAHFTDLLHFDGKRWAPSPMPRGAEETYEHLILQDIYARSASNVWAVGYSRKFLWAGFRGYQPLVMHWDGNEWAIMATPQVPILDENVDGGELTDVVALAPGDVWAIGRATYDWENDDSPTRLVYHWDGSEWRSVTGGGRYEYDVFHDVIRAPYSRTLWFLGGDSENYIPLLQRHKANKVLTRLRSGLSAVRSHRPSERSHPAVMGFGDLARRSGDRSVRRWIGSSRSRALWPSAPRGRSPAPIR